MPSPIRRSDPFLAVGVAAGLGNAPEQRLLANKHQKAATKNETQT